MKRLPHCLCLSLVILLTGCAIEQRVERSESFAEKEICVIENPDVPASFLEAYERALLKRGYSVRRMASSSTLRACPITSTYTGNWSWDILLYMSYANLRLYKVGREIASVTYDSTQGGHNFGKFINADSKIDEMTNQLVSQEPVKK